MNKLGPILRTVGAYGLLLFFIWIGWTAIDHHEDEPLRWYVTVGTSAVLQRRFLARCLKRPAVSPSHGHRQRATAPAGLALIVGGRIGLVIRPIANLPTSGG
jgi:hypothetical protein